MTRQKSNKINLYKINPEHSFTDITFEGIDGFVKEYEDATRKLFIRKKQSGKPLWLEYVKPLLTTFDPEEIKNSSSSFILIIKHNSNTYALGGGSIHAKIEKYIVEDFGVRLALRMIKGIQALNQRSLKGSTRQIYRAVIGYEPIFDKENFTRVLNSIVGTGEFEKKSFRVEGKSSLSLRTAKNVNQLDEVLDEIESIESQGEKIHFPSSFILEKNDSVIQQLDKAMLNIVQEYWVGNSNREQLYLEFKDIFTQFRCTNFKGKYRRYGIEFDNFDLDIIKRLFIEKGLTEINDFDDLDRIKLSGYTEEGYEEFKKSFRKLLVCEISKNEKSFIKIDNRWSIILDEIQQFIDEELKKVPILKGILPDWDRRQHKEEFDYNNFVAGQKNWKCMDCDPVQFKGLSKVEVCDIFDKTEKRFFHIKETWGCKSAYLFTQGATSAEFFYNSEEFRKKCIDKWPDQFQGDYLRCKVVFGIAANKAVEDKFPINMTFFAKLNLYNAISILKQFDYTTFLAPIKIIS